MIIAGNGIYEKCCDCGKLVKINKFLFGSLHLCLTEEEKHRKAFGNPAPMKQPLGGPPWMGRWK